MPVNQEITENLQEIINSLISNLLNKLKPFLIAISILIVIYLLYKLISFILFLKAKRREKLTYYNTEKILKKLETIEEKINSFTKKKEKKKSK